MTEDTSELVAESLILNGPREGQTVKEWADEIAHTHAEGLEASDGIDDIPDERVERLSEIIQNSYVEPENRD